MPKKRLSVALIGAGGNMRNAHVPRIVADGAVVIAAVADPVESQARLLMDRVGHDIPRSSWLRAAGLRLAGRKANGSGLSLGRREPAREGPSMNPRLGKTGG